MTPADAAFVDTIRSKSHPLTPVPSGAKPVLRSLADVKAVLFDVYGTLLVSGSGPFAPIGELRQASALVETLSDAGLCVEASPIELLERLHRVIAHDHQRSRVLGIEHPEVAITAMWRKVLKELRSDGMLTGPADVDLAAFSLDYELRVNPVWPMPGAQRCLTELSARGVTLGVVSNGQWYTPLMFPALMGGCLQTLGVPPDLQFWSYRVGEAKPGLAMFRHARAALDARGIPSEKVLFVGNDVVGDVEPAAAMGFRTALFAGDGRSLRLRADESGATPVVPELVILNLLDVIRCVRPGE